MTIKLTVWGAIRRNDSGEYAIVSEMAAGPELVRGLVDANAETVPSWHKANPVQRIAYFTVVEGEG